MNLTELSLQEAAQGWRAHSFSAVELVRAYLQRIERLDPHLNCFITLTAEAALTAARQADEDLQRGQLRSALHGLPLALKDLYETAGIRTTAGSTFFKDYVPEQDGTVVSRLKSAGSIFLGKLNMHEIALGVTNVNPHYGPCCNPWNLERCTGGSSGGSAAALAAGLCPASVGSDTGGSIRIPAALCGVVGLKPTYGRVSLRGVMPLSWNLDHAGPMGRCVRDVAILLQVMAGYDAQDPASLAVPVDDYLSNLEGGLGGWRVALATGEYFEVAEAAICAAVQTAAQIMETLGARVESVTLPYIASAAQANGLMVTSDAAAFHRQRLAEHPNGFGADVLQRLQAGAAATSTDYALARRTQSTARRSFEQLFETYDVLMLPATPITAPAIRGQDAVEQARRLTRFTAPFNLTGLPALSLPCGFATDGLPIGLQLVARPWDEARLLQAAFAYEQATCWHTRRPPDF